MRRSTIVGALALVSLLGRPMPSSGTTGGPDLIEVLGWDPVDQKVFVAQHYRGESGYPPAIAYFDLRGRSPGRPVVVPWSVSLDSDPTRYQRRASALRARLRALPPSRTTPSFHSSKVLAIDTVDVQGLDMTRYRVRVSRLDRNWDGSLEVQTYQDSTVRVVSVHPVPGHRERLAIISFVGIPYEGGYETQIPMLVGSSLQRPRIEWAPFRR